MSESGPQAPAPSSKPSDESARITILEATDAAELACAESALREAAIPFVTRNAAIQHLLGAGQIGGRNLVTGPPEIQVAATDHGRATEVLREAFAEADPSALPCELEPGSESAEEAESRALAIRWARYSAVWAAFHLWGVGSVLGLYFGVKALRTSTDLPTTQKGLAIFGIALGTLGALARVAILLL